MKDFFQKHKKSTTYTLLYIHLFAQKSAEHAQFLYFDSKLTHMCACEIH